MTDGALLTELAGLGPFFALGWHPAGSAPSDGWRPLEELLRQPGVLGTRVAATRAALAEASGQPPGDVELRVAASMTQLGLAARLVCPALGAAALTGRPPRIDPARMRWRPGPGGAVALSISDGALLPTSSAAADPAALAGALADSVLNGPVRALVQTSAQFGVSPQVLWGNVASVVNGARALIGVAAPGLSGPAEQIVSGLLARPPLHGRHQGSAAAGFRRRSCCLVYRLVAAAAPVCGDCVLTRGPTRADRGATRADRKATPADRGPGASTDWSG
ncbi:MAG TPA: (2Fe-2S)-binding protein [Jatrophihabitans sp.]|uniref:(2Fe-2S)-binding protein n=1 Tax=Jatrophihabitans sp. TaxID=1932789 RepID=UPI002EF3ECA6